jgi:hypothetical protein
MGSSDGWLCRLLECFIQLELVAVHLCFCSCRLLEGIELYKEDWEKIASYVGKSQSACLTHFVRLPIEDPYVDDLLNWTGTDLPLVTLHFSP